MSKQLRLKDLDYDKDYSKDFLLEEWGQIKLYHHINRGDVFRIRPGYYRRT